MTTKIELTSVTEESKGCGDNCGCATAKVKQEVAPLATAACSCQTGGVCTCGENCSCGTDCC
jgi:hypothetical protein